MIDKKKSYVGKSGQSTIKRIVQRIKLFERKKIFDWNLCDESN